MKKVLSLIVLAVAVSTASFANTTAPKATTPVVLEQQNTAEVVKVSSRKEMLALADQLTAGKKAQVTVQTDIIIIIFDDGTVIIIIIEG